MQKLQPILGLINTLIVDSVRVSLASVSEQALGIQSSVSTIQLRTEAAEGITLEGLQAAVESVQLPHPGDFNLYATLFLEQVDIRIAPEFWERAAKVAKERLVANLGLLVDTVELRGIRIKIQMTPAKVLDLRVTMDQCLVKVVGQTMVDVANLDLEVKGFATKEKDKKKALADAKVRLQKLKVRVLELTMNRVIDVVRPKIPSFVSNIDIALNQSTLKVSAKTSYLPMSIPVELQFTTRNNQFGVHIVKVFIGLAKPLVKKAVQKVTANKPGVRAEGDNIWIDPWGRLPIAVEFQVQTFAIQGGALEIAFAALPEPEPALPAPVEPEIEVVEIIEEVVLETPEE